MPYIAYFFSGVPLYYFVSDYKNQKTLIKHIFFLSFLVFLLTIIIFYCRVIFGPFPVITSNPPTIFRLFYSLLFFCLCVNLLSYPIVTRVFRKLAFDDFGVNSLFILLLHPYFVQLVVPMVNTLNNVFKFDINNNKFVIIVIITAYTLTMLSLWTLKLLPKNIQSIFSR